MQKKVMLVVSVLLYCSAYGMENTHTVVDTTERVTIGSGTLPPEYKNDVRLGNIKEGPDGYPVLNNWLKEAENCYSIFAKSGEQKRWVGNIVMGGNDIWGRYFLALNTNIMNEGLKEAFIFENTFKN